MIDDYEFDDVSDDTDSYDDTSSESDEVSDSDDAEPTDVTEEGIDASPEDFSDLDDAEPTDATEEEIDASPEDFSDLDDAEPTDVTEERIDASPEDFSDFDDAEPNDVTEEEIDAYPEDFSDLDDAEPTDVIEEEIDAEETPMITESDDMAEEDVQPSLPIPNGRHYYDPRKRSDESLQKDVERGKIDGFKRSDVGGHYTYKKISDGRTLIKDVEPADNPKGHQQTDFIVKDGRIISIKSHNDE